MEVKSFITLGSEVVSGTQNADHPDQGRRRAQGQLLSHFGAIGLNEADKFESSAMLIYSITKESIYTSPM